MNSTEWEITLHLHDYDEFWMHYATGRGSDKVILNSNFQDIIFISAVHRFNSEIFHYFENSWFLRHRIWHPKLCLQYGITELEETENPRVNIFSENCVKMCSIGVKVTLNLGYLPIL